MYAIIEISGKQVKAVPEGKLIVNKINEEEGTTIEHDKVLLFSDENNETKVGKPYLEDIKVKLEVMKHFKGKKLIVFKKRRRKGSKVKRGFRPHLTLLKVKEIVK